MPATDLDKVLSIGHRKGGYGLRNVLEISHIEQALLLLWHIPLVRSPFLRHCHCGTLDRQRAIAAHRTLMASMFR